MDLEVIARLKIRPGQLEAFKYRIAEILRATREHDTHTLRCDWFINNDGTECEVHEADPNEQELIEHNKQTIEASTALLMNHALDHHATIHGEVPQDLIHMHA